MAIYKQIQAKFWQNSFVLELTPEERYFYTYIITNTMTTACGIYRFNLKLAVLETGLGSEVIKKYLGSFECSKKIVVSKTSTEIMIVNWLKHNFRTNKKTVTTINAELKEVKDKELIRQFYEICRQRECPVEEIFKGVVLPEEVKEEINNVVQAMTNTPTQNIIQAALQNQVLNSVQGVPEDPGQNNVQAIQSDSGQQVECATEPSQAEAKESKTAAGVLLFKGLNEASKGKRSSKVEDILSEEVEVFETFDEDEQEHAITGTPIMTWNFCDSSDTEAAVDSASG